MGIMSEAPLENSQDVEGDSSADRRSKLRVEWLATSSLQPDPLNPRRHNRAQVRAIAKSIEAFGFNVPILVDRNNKVVAGHGRLEAAKLRGDLQVPAILLDHLTETQARAFMLADNQLVDRSSWDEVRVATQLKELLDLDLDFDLDATGFELPEIDLRIRSLDEPDSADKADEFKPLNGAPISVAGDLWLLGPHRLYCGSAIDPNVYAFLMEGEKAAGVIADAPYNARIGGNVSGKGSFTHREFMMASGEMTLAEFANFLTQAFAAIQTHSLPGSIIYSFMDWRHIVELLDAARSVGCDVLNICVWVKSNAGLGSFYRSQHEFVVVFRNGRDAHINNVQLGRFGRNRTNVWNYPGANSFPRKNTRRQLDLHPTIKPIALISDAILDSTRPGDIVLDPFLGSGTSLLAAHRTGRRCYGIEIDPLYVDTTIDRWQRISGRSVTHVDGHSFEALRIKRGICS
jgi:DNA modification methylase